MDRRAFLSNMRSNMCATTHASTTCACTLDRRADAPVRTRNHRCRQTSRLTTAHDLHACEEAVAVSSEDASAIVARHVLPSEAGPGLRGSALAHRWRSSIWPYNVH